MNLTAPREPLLAALQLVSAAAATRTGNPVLACVKLEAAGDALTLSAFDTEVGVRYEVRGVTAPAPGVAVVPPARLVAALRECSDAAEVALDATAAGVRVRLGAARFELPCHPADQFPGLPAIDDGGRYHEATAGVLRAMIRRTQFALGTDQQKFTLSGVLWEAEGKAARLVATDGKRLAVCEGPATLYGPADATKGGHLIPKKSLAILDRTLGDDGELVRVGLRPNEAVFRTERATIYTRLLDGRYPPYRDIIGQSRRTAAVKVSLPAGAFLSHVRQAAVMTGDESKRVDMTFGPGKVAMSARGQEAGSSEVEMPLPGYDGPEVRIAFDPQYLVEFLKGLDAAAPLVLEMTDGTRPAIFRSGDEYLYLVMPLSE